MKIFLKESVVELFFVRKTVERVFLIFTLLLRVENEVKTSILIRVDVKRYLVVIFLKQLFEEGSLPEK